MSAAARSARYRDRLKTGVGIFAVEVRDQYALLNMLVAAGLLADERVTDDKRMIERALSAYIEMRARGHA